MGQRFTVAARGRLLLPVLAVSALVALVSFLGGSVGSILTGRPPMALLAVGTPHLELAAGRPFASVPVTNTLRDVDHMWPAHRCVRSRHETDGAGSFGAAKLR